MNPENCPVQREAARSRQAAQGLARSLRMLRRSLSACEACLALAGCTYREQFNRQVEAAIGEINAEWRRQA